MVRYKSSLSAICGNCSANLLRLQQAAQGACVFQDQVTIASKAACSLQSLLDACSESAFQPYLEDAYCALMKDVEGGLLELLSAIQACTKAGPLQALILQDELSESITNACIRISKSLQEFEEHGNGGMACSLAESLSEVLRGVAVDYTTLATLRRTLHELQQEAEAMRCGRKDGSEFSALLSSMFRGCPMPLLQSDVAMLQERLMHVKAQGRHVTEFFYSQTLSIMLALAGMSDMDTTCTSPLKKETASPGKARLAGPASAIRMTANMQQLRLQPPSGNTTPTKPSATHGAMPPKASASNAATAELYGASADTVAAATGASALRTVQSGSLDGAVTAPMPVAAAVACITAAAGVSAEMKMEALAALNSQAMADPRAMIKDMLACDGVTALVRQLQVSAVSDSIRLHTIRTLGLMTDDEASLELMMMAKLPRSLVHAIDTVMEQGQKQQLQQQPAKGRAISGSSASAYGSSRSSRSAVSSSRDGSGDVASVPLDAVQQELCSAAAGLLTKLADTHVEDLCEAGAVAALSQLLKAAATWTPSAQQQQVVRAALAALAVMMRHAEAALQMLKLNMMPALVPLAADGSSQALQAAASTAIQHILQHAVEPDEALGWDAASRGPSKSSVPSSSSSGGGSDTHRSGPSSVSSASSVYTSDLGRACSTATVSALMVLASSSAGIIHPQLQPHSGPALYLLLHASAGSEARSGVLGNDEGMAGVLHQAGQGVLVAMRLVRRLAMDEALQPQVAQRLARALAAESDGAAQVQLALTLALVLQPSSIKDRGALRAAAEACSEVAALKAVKVLQHLMGRADMTHRAAGLACMHALCMHGGRSVCSALVANDAIVQLVDCCKLETSHLDARMHALISAAAAAAGGPSSSALAPSTSTSSGQAPTLSQMAAEALAALAAVDTAWRKQVCVSLVAFLGSNSPGLASCACQTLLTVLGDSSASRGPSDAMSAAATSACSVLGELGAVRHVCELLNSAVGVPNSSFSAAGPTISMQSNSSSGGAGCGSQLLTVRAVRLLAALCRASGENAKAAVAGGACKALLLVMGPYMDLALRYAAVCAAGALIKKSPAAQEQFHSAGGVPLMLEVLKAAALAAVPRRGQDVASQLEQQAAYEEVVVALASLALHAPSRADLVPALRQMLLRGSRQEVAGAALACACMASGAGGREALFGEELLDPLVKLLNTGDLRSKAWASDALYLAAMPAQLALKPCMQYPAGATIKPKGIIVRAGVVAPLLAILRSTAAPSSLLVDGQAGAVAPGANANAHGVSGTGQGSASAAALEQQRQQAMLAAAADSVHATAQIHAAEALDCLCGCEEGVAAVRGASGIDVLKEVVARGKRKEVHERAASAASAALLKVL